MCIFTCGNISDDSIHCHNSSVAKIKVQPLTLVLGLWPDPSLPSQLQSLNCLFTGVRGWGWGSLSWEGTKLYLGLGLSFNKVHLEPFIHVTAWRITTLHSSQTLTVAPLRFSNFQIFYHSSFCVWNFPLIVTIQVLPFLPRPFLPWSIFGTPHHQ